MEEERKGLYVYSFYAGGLERWKHTMYFASYSDFGPLSFKNMSYYPILSFVFKEDKSCLPFRKSDYPRYSYLNPFMEEYTLIKRRLIHDILH